mmetsp:Transcript_3633/g.3073  ORF Transcript_3633/g.3073 Transcript_3633/m.3073 type:complete len:81 (+) Transcript_3633:821-1063(+)
MYCSSLISEGKVNGIKCPDGSCGKYISENDIRKIVTQQDYLKYEKFKVHMMVELAEDKTWCPVVECGAVAEIKGKNLFGE